MTPLNYLYKALAMVALSFLAAGGDPATAPTAVISVTTASPAVGSAMRFIDASAGAPTSWEWDFGDGTKSNSAAPQHRYTAPGTYVVGLRVANGAGSSIATEMLTVVAADTLRLMSAHPFDVTLTATDPRTGTTGQGQVVAQNDIYGIFSIPAITGNAGNPEVLVKMVDASGIGQSYWVFYGALTDLSYTLTVRDVATGRAKTYRDAKVGSTVCGQFDTSGFGASLTATASALGRQPLIADQAGEDTLRLVASHPFEVKLTASDPRTGTTGQGQLISQTDIYGTFSIPAITGNSSNPEVIVKMVDASGIGANYWVFYSALTDLNYTLTVKETATGRTKTYRDAKVGTTVCGAFDTSGFLQAPLPTPTVTGGSPPPTPTPTPPPSGAVTRVVNVGPNNMNVFNDTVSGNSTTTIHVGDTVRWDFKAGPHSTTSGTCSGTGGYYGDEVCDPSGEWDSGRRTTNATFSHTFAAAGDYRYFCNVHNSMMTGLVKVLP
ncbi:MAG: PKD domain-containing protein [Acidobacteriota bacterium]|nr:PKD domain-containing protein [Acidobacteriota bacterium]